MLQFPAQTQVMIYSPDTDVFFIGLSIVLSLNKTVYVQLKDSPYDCIFLCMNKLIDLIMNDSQLQDISVVVNCLQLLYIYSGCDFVSYFRGFGQKTFFDVFRKNSSFIVGDGECSDIYCHSGLMSFYRLICSIYFTKHCTTLLTYSNPEALFDSFSAEDVHDRHILFVTETRERQWERWERVVSEVEMMPNPEALNLHLKRCCWGFHYQSQCNRTQFLLEIFQILDGKLVMIN